MIDRCRVWRMFRGGVALRLVRTSIVVLALIACGGAAPAPSPQTIAVPPTPTTALNTATAPVVPTVPAISPSAPASAATSTGATPNPVPAGPSHVFLIVMENHEAMSIIGNRNAPYINQLAAQYVVADQYYAIRHPSLPNYLALIGGDTYGIDSDCIDCFQDAPNLVDALEAGGKTWKSYQEDMPQPCFLRPSVGKYALKHNPFLYFTDIRTDPARCNRVVPFPQLDADLAGGTVPDFAWITPNLIHDMHDGTVADGDQWLATWVQRILQSDAWKQNGQLFIVWDEGESNDGCCGIAAGGRIPLLVIAPNGPSAYHVTTPLTHYSLLGTVEEQWGLTRIGHSGDANVGLLPEIVRRGALP